MQRFAPSVVLWIGSVSALACSRARGSGLGGTVTVDGSSTVFLVTEAAAEEFQKTTPAYRVTVGISGTGGGFKKLCNAEVDVAQASRPIKPSESAQCQANGVEYVELPIAYDGLAVVVSHKNDFAKDITTAELERIWTPEAQGRVTRWSDVRAGYPDKPLRLYGPGVDSGSYDYFTEAIVGREHASRGDFTSSEDDNVLAQGVASDEAALGYFGFAYYEQNRDKLRALPVDDGDPENGAGPVPISMETVRNGSYQPLSRPIFLYVSKQALDKPYVYAFVKYYLSHAVPFVREVGYIPLPERAYVLAKERLDQRRTGSLFGAKGSQVGVSVEELLSLEAQ